MLKPFGYSASNFKISKFSYWISSWVTVSLDLEVFVNWSIMVNFGCLLKLWLSCWKRLQAIIASTFFSFFDDYSVLMFVSAFARHCLLHELHQIYNVEVVKYLIYIFIGYWLLKVVLRTCLQQSDLKFVRYGEHLPGFSSVFVFFWMCSFKFFTSY